VESGIGARGSARSVDGVAGSVTRETARGTNKHARSTIDAASLIDAIVDDGLDDRSGIVHLALVEQNLLDESSRRVPRLQRLCALVRLVRDLELSRGRPCIRTYVESALVDMHRTCDSTVLVVVVDVDAVVGV